MNIFEIKNNLPISKVLARYNLEPDKHHMVKCPFHDDGKPSMKIYLKTNTFYCFGCNKSGDVIEFIQLMEKCDKYKAIQIAESMIPGSVPIQKQYVKPQNKPIMDIPKLLHQFKQSLPRSQKALEYLKKRGLDANKLDIGYNTGKTHSHARNCITFALKDENEKEVDYYGSSIYGGHFYNTDRKGLYPGYPKQETTKLIITEAIVDAATLLQLEEIINEYTILSAFGINGINGEHTKGILKLKNLTEIIFAFDGDDAGYKAVHGHTNEKGEYKKGHAEILNELLPKVIISTLLLPDGEDINSLYQLYDNPDYFIDLLDKRKVLINNKHEQNRLPPGEPDTKLPFFDTKNPNKITYTTKNTIFIIKGEVSKDLRLLKATIEIKNPKMKQSKYYRPDLYDDNQLEKTAHDAAEKLGIRVDILEMELRELRILLEEHREKKLEAETTGEETKKLKKPVPEAEIPACTSFWKQPKLFRQIYNFLGMSGIVGEERSRMLVFCIATSAGMHKTLHGIIKGNSGKGKTYLMSLICELLPPEIYMPVTTLTDKSLFNSGKYAFQGCMLTVEDRSTMTDEIKIYFREFQSKEWIARRVTVSDKDGKFKAIQQKIIGPLSTMSCTTDEEIYPDDENRCFIISVDESKEQRQRILEYRSKLSAGLINKTEINKTREFMRNCIRLLQPYEVINPYATQLHLPEDVRDEIRLYDLFLKLVDQITILHQFQREKDNQGRLIATLEDVRLAVETMFDAIIIKADDLTDKVRKTFELMKALIKTKCENYKDYKFKVREIRLGLNMRKSTLDDHIRMLHESEYLVHAGGSDRTGNLYKIAYWDDYSGMRERIKKYLYAQIEKLEQEQKNKGDQQ